MQAVPPDEAVGAGMTTLTVGIAQHIGQRDTQEDAVLSLPGAGLFAVADGLGGHERGEEAAETAIQTLILLAEARLEGRDPATAPGREMGLAFEAADQAVRALGICRVTGTTEHKMSCYCRSPGTTLTALWFVAGGAWLGHIGDSRCYWLGSEAPLRQVSTDHASPWGGLSQCLGSRAGIRPQILSLSPVGLWLLCSDGLTGTLSDGEIEGLLRQGGPAAEMADRLVWEALAKGAERQDNLTAIVVEANVDRA